MRTVAGVVVLINVALLVAVAWNSHRNPARQVPPDDAVHGSEDREPSSTGVQS